MVLVLVVNSDIVTGMSVWYVDTTHVCAQKSSESLSFSQEWACLPPLLVMIHFVLADLGAYAYPAGFP